MSQFEFLGSVTIGQYLPLASPVHRLDPRARLVAYFLLIMTITVAPGAIGIAIALAVTLALLAASRVPLRYALRCLLPPLPFLLILALLQVFLNAVPDSGPQFFSIGTIIIGLSDLGAGGMLLLRFSALVLALSLASFTLSTGEMIVGLGYLLRPLARLGLPVHDFVMVIQVTLRFLPLLAQTAERIAKAQAARGADWDARGGNLFARVRRIIPLIVPLFLVSLRRAEAMALAMDARGYGSVEDRTSRVELHFTVRDGLVILGMGAICLTIFGINLL